ncbi:Outer membrane protein assembly factor YaeT precursor [Rhodovulum sp. P5]|uniref:autotransporter assembly complex protein TamA n=1 Tax=Rhodovulum sp. P5 TaxID=1564506 RepID=UPI0009C33841|nr:autotransporter assembly complex family protein [Rhodovulum sp. P5]ARE39637.1 Outer membrane protein assembly factor YaeT precursor [Rhodovulum sp. P5]
MIESSPRNLLAALALLSTSAGAAVATEVRITEPGGDNSAVKAVESAALTVRTVANEEATAQDIYSAALADYSRIVGALYARGYYGPVVNIRLDGREASYIAPLSVPSSIGVVEIKVQTGPAFTFSRAEIGPLAPGTVLPDGFAAGKPAESGLIRQAASAGVEAWRAASHAKAEISGQRIAANHRNATLSADLKLSPGPAVTFGKLVIEGDSRVRRKRLHDIAGLPEGDPFDPEKLEDSADRLRKTGAFRSVRLAEAETLAPDDSMDITLEVVDDKPRRFGFGAELYSQEGLSLSSFWMHRNLLGGAERLRFDLEISGVGGADDGGEDFSLNGLFERPATFDPDTGLYVLAGIKRDNEPNYTEDSSKFGFGLTHDFSDRLSARSGLLLNYSDIRDDLGERYMYHAMFPTALTWDGRESDLDTRNGFYLNLQATPLLGLGGEAEDGAQIKADMRAYRGIGERLVLAGRLQIGSILEASAQGVPSDLLFFSGGGGTVRGQPYQSLAVELDNGDEIGGRSFIGLSAEARMGVTRSIGVVAFADAGFIGPNSWMDDGKWHSGAGLGLRYDTGIGPIRFDVAAPMGGGTGDGVQFYIGIGQAF